MSEPLHILVLEDNPADAELIKLELEENELIFTSKWVTNEKEFVLALQEFTPHLILSDYDLPTYNGVLALAESKRRCPEVPFILVTGAVSEDRAIEILTQGAKDYVLKSRLQQKLVPAIRRVLAEAEERKARKWAELKLREAHKTLKQKVKARTTKLEAEIAARKKIEQEREQLLKSFKESEEKYRKIFEGATEGIFQTTPEGLHLSVNPALARMHGYTSPQDMIDSVTNIGEQQYVNPKDREEFVRLLYEQDHVEGYEVEVYRKDGSRFWMSINGHTVRDDSGNVLYFEGTNVDITARKNTEGALLESQEYTKILFDSSIIPLIVMDADTGVYIDCNEAAVKIYGYASREEVLNKTPFDVSAPTQYNGLNSATEAQNCIQLCRENSSHVFEWRHQRPNGQIWDAEVHLMLFQHRGRPLMQFTLHDITARKQAEDALRESEERFNLSMEATNDGLWDWNIKTDAGYFSPGYYNMLGYETNAFPAKGSTWKELIHPDDFEHAVQANMDRIEGGRNDHFEVEYRMKAKNGEWRWILGRGKCVARDEKGYALRLVGTHVDITNRKRVEETLEKQRQQLENANKELESFSYSISHDLRAPLRAIDGFSQMIIKNHGAKFDEDALNKFNVIRRNTETMGQLVDGLLELSRLGRKALTMSAIDMDNLIREVWEEIEVINPGRKMSLTIKPVPPCFGDVQLIRQVYSNLLANAVKFTKDRNVALIETGGFADDVKGNVYFVKDNGAGFDMAYSNKLFGVFQRLHSAEEFEGTGIGLATIQRIINKHGGRVWAEGKVDEGATFYFSFPASQIQRINEPV